MAERTKGPRLYRTTKTVRQSLGEIIALLSEFGCESFHVQQKDGQPQSIAFVHHGIAFQLSPDIAGLEQRLKSARTSTSAAAVGWAQIRNLLELQLEIVESGLMKAEAMFGGHALTAAGRTVAAMLEERRHELMPGETRLLPGGFDA